MNLHHVRLAILSLLILAIGLFVLVGFLQIVLPVVAFFIPSLETPFFDWGVYGPFRSLDYVSFNLTSPLVTTPVWNEQQCDDDSFVLLTVKGDSVDHPGPTILDSRGNLVWMSSQFKDTTNLKLQTYQGQKYLTFWSGEKTGGQGKGVYYMLNSHYEVVYTIRAVGEDVHADLHEFKITDQGTALISIYNTTTMNMSDIGRPQKGWIEDSVFQEVDIATNKLIFEWRASEHIYAWETYMTHPFAGYIKAIPFDFFHINSVDKDKQGNYLISSRHMHSISCISPSGRTLWTLGGKRNEFTDLSNGEATAFKWQHDARWMSEPDSDGVGILTLFDNKEAGPLHADGPYSRGMMLRVDLNKKTVELMHEYISLQGTRAPSQGSTEVLDDGNVFIGWGHSPSYSQFTTDGTLICETHFGASKLEFFGNVVSYRAQKIRSHEWTGTPHTLPNAHRLDDKIYVSWNGATEVVAWGLEALKSKHKEEQGKSEKVWEEIDIVKKEQFEEIFILNEYVDDYEEYRVAAIDRNGQTITHSGVMDAVQKTPKWLKVMGWILLWAGFFVGAGLCWKNGWHRHVSLNWRWKDGVEYRKLERISSA